MNAQPKRPQSRAGHQRGQRFLARGIWLLRYREPPDATGNRKQRTVPIGPESAFKTLADVHAGADLILARVAPLRITPGTVMPWTQCCDRFKNLYLTNLSKGTQRIYTSIIECHVEPSFRELNAHEIGAPQIQDWLSKQQNDGIPRNTIMGRYRVLRRIIRRSANDGLAATMPPRGVLEFPRDRGIRQRLESKAFTVEQMDLMIARAEPLWFAVLLALLRFTGARVGEAAGLAWPNVEITGAEPLIRIVQSASDGVIGDVKNRRSNRDVPIAPPLLELLSAWQKQCPPTPQWFVFPGPRGRPLTTSGVRLRHLRPLLQQLDLPPLSFHGLRHGACYAMFEGGGNAADICYIMGHSNLKQTSEYAESRPEGRRAAVLGASVLRKSFEKP